MEEKEMASVGMNVDRRENGESTNAKTVDPKAKGDANPNNSKAKGDANPNAKKNDKEKKKKAGIIIGVVGLSVAAAIAAAAGAKGCAPNERSYTVTYLTDDEVQNFQGGSVNVKEGTSIGDLKRQLAPLDGYEVEGFYKDPDCTLEFRDDERVNDDTKIYIEYKQIEITLIFHNDNNPSDNDFGSMTVKYFDNLSKKEMPTPKNYNSDEGSYTFNCWKTLDGKVVNLKNMNSGKDLLAIDADGEIDLYAEFDFEAIKKYTLNFDKGIKVSRANGDEIASGEMVKEGEILTVEGSVDDVWTISVGEVSGLTLNDGNSYTVTGGDSETISITSKVEHEYLEFVLKDDQTYYVKGLKAEADETNIVIPDNHYDGSAITDICGGTVDGGGAFANNSTITSVVIGANIRVVGEYAFYNCSALNSVEFKGTVSEYLGACSFANCRALQRLTLYPTTSALWDVFVNCSNISEINFMGTADEFASMPHNNLFPNVEHEFVLKLNGVEAETIELSVSEIPGLQFAYCTSIKNVILKDTVKTIEGSAFRNCKNLANITFGNGLTKIGGGAFSNCTSIKHLYLKEGLTEIGASAFNGCNGLIDVVLPASLTKIDDAGFYGEHVSDIIFYYASTSSKFAELQIVGGEKDSMTDKNVYYYSQQEPKFEQGKTYWHYGEGNAIELWQRQNVNITFDDGIKVSKADGSEISSGDTVNVGDVLTVEAARELESDWILAVGDFSGLTKGNGNEYTVTGIATISSRVEHKYLTFTLKDDQTYEVKGMKEGATETNIVIPDNHYDGKAITSIYGYYNSWRDYSGAFCDNDKIQSVVIGNNVTSIGKYAFYSCSGLQSVTIGENVTSIGDEAFEYCRGLTSVTIGKNVTSIGSIAFKDCSNLSSVTYKGTADEWVSHQFSKGFDYAFDLTTSEGLLTEYTFTSNVPAYALQQVRSLTSVTIGEGCTSIGYDAFNQCTGLTSVTIGDNVTSIGSAAFNNCNKLTSVIIPDNVTSIGDGAFEYCSGLTEIIWNAASVADFSIGGYNDVFFNAGKSGDGITVIFGDSVQNIPANCFNTTDERSTPKITSVTIGKNVTSIGNYAFNRCSGLTSVTIGENVTSIGIYAFDRCFGFGFGLTEVNYTGTIDQWASINFGNYSANPLNNYGAQLKIGGENAIKENMTINASSIGSYAFYGCSIIKNITLGVNVTSIGDSAFSNCFGLTSVTYNGTADDWVSHQLSRGFDYAFDLTTSEGLLTEYTFTSNVPKYALQQVKSLTSVTFGEGCTSIGGNAFYKCSSLSSVTIGENVTSIGDLAFSCCTSLTSVTIGKNVTSIGSSAFKDCSGLTSVTIGNNVTSIGGNAFINCSRLTSVTYKGTVDEWVNHQFSKGFNTAFNLTTSEGLLTEYTFNSDVPAYALQYVKSLTNVTFGEGCTSIGVYAFYKCSSLSSITIGEGVTSIGDSAFRDCSGLTSITIPNSVTSIGSYAFYKCSGLTSVTIGDNVTSIGDSAFEGCNRLTSVIIPDSVKRIGSSAFEDCSRLTSITIPNSVTSIGYWAFDGCSGLKKVYYKGDEAGWKNLKSSIGSYNTNLTNAHIYFYEQTNPYTDHEEYEDDKYWHYNEGDTTTPVVWTKENQ